MSLVLRTLSNTGAGLVAQDGSVLSNVDVTFLLVDPLGNPTASFDSVSHQRVSPISKKVTTSSIGEFTVSLWPNARASSVTYYKCSVSYPGVQDILGIITEGTGSVTWNDFTSSVETLNPTDISAFALHTQDYTRHLTNNQNLALDAANNANAANPFATLADIIVAGGGHVLQDEGQNVPAEPRINFTGYGVTVTDDPDNGATVVTIDQGQTVDASDIAKGIVLLSVPPVDQPIAAGNNDPRLSDARTPLSHLHHYTDLLDVTISAADLNKLDDGSDTTLHYHASDRSRATHTGTQAWSTVSKTGSKLSDIADIPLPVAGKVMRRTTDNTGYEWVDTSSGSSDHEALSNLQGGASNDHKHLTGSQATYLTTGVDTSLHYHSADRNVDVHVDGTTNKVYSASDKSKLAGIAIAATANSTDAQLRDRTTHTGVQVISTVTGLQTALDAKQSIALVDVVNGKSYKLVMVNGILDTEEL